MTLAPPHGVTDPTAEQPSVVASVTAVLVLRGPVSALRLTLDSLARQTRVPERLLVVDPGGDGNAVEVVRAHQGVAEAIGAVTFVTVPPVDSVAHAARLGLRAARESAGAEVPAGRDADEVPHVWVLTSDTAAAPMTLTRLLDAVRRSPSVGAAGPKLLEWSRPGALRSVGIQMTRSGRLIAAPSPGEPDQGQYDRRSDVLAVPARGMLAEQALFEALGGTERALGDFGADVDFSWRAQQAGRRVVVVPRATARAGADPDEGDEVTGDPVTRTRRQARRVALTRCAIWALPLLAVWIAGASCAAALALLLAKRPRAAWTEFSDLGAVLTPGRLLRARWTSRGSRTVRRRDLGSLFVPSGAMVRHTGDLIHDQIALGRAERAPDSLAGIESGPVAEEVQDLNVLGATWASSAARNPGLLAVLTAAVVAVVASRNLGGGVVDRLDHGLVGGELFGGTATAGTLWHTWLDGWHGAGLGQGGEQGPHLAVLAAVAWLVTHLPLVGVPASPVGAATTVIVLTALPLATLTAYLGARVITHARWLRAVAALAWAGSAVLTTAVASGRLGGIVAAVLLPLVAAGFALAARRSGTATVTAATILATAVLGAFVPALLVLAVLTGLVVLVLGHGGARVRGLSLALGPVLLLGPWVAALVERPLLLLTGPGLSVWGAAQADPWQLALLHPGGPGSYPVLVSAPLVLAGLAGLLRTGQRGRVATGLLVLAVLGLAAALAAPRIVLGTVPVGSAHPGAPVTAWAGTGVLVLTLALVASALLGAEGLPARRAEGGWPAVARWPVAGAAVLAVVAALGATAWHTVGSTLTPWQDPRPAVAADQAESGLGNRMLLLEPQGNELAFSLLGREVGDPVRSLPPQAQDRPGTESLTAAVGGLFAQGAAPGEFAPARDLSDQGIGFVGLRTDPTDPRIRTLDATAGLSRLGDHDGVLFWRVLAGGGAAGDEAVAPSRARLVTARSQQAVPVLGDHSRLVARAVVPPKATLVLAEPAAWVRHARVSVDGEVVAPIGDRAAYALPAGPGRIAVEVLPDDGMWRYLQGVFLLLVVFVAVPFGNRASRRRT